MPIINNNWLEYTHTPDLYEMLLIGFQQFAAITFAFDILSVGIRAHFFASLSLSQPYETSNTVCNVEASFLMSLQSTSQTKMSHSVFEP